MPITSVELARRWKAARETAGLSQDAVARALSVPRSAIAQIEAARRKVASLELERFAHLVGRSVTDLVRESFDETSTLSELFASEPALATAEDVLAEVRRHLAWARERATLERMLDIERGGAVLRQYDFAPPRSVWEAVRHGTDLAEAERRRLALASAPIDDLRALVESQGVRVAFVALPAAVVGLRLRDADGTHLVFVDRAQTEWHRRFALAREYAHVLLDHDELVRVSRASFASEPREVRASTFAAAFLLPEDAAVRALTALGKPFAHRRRTWVLGAGESVVAEARIPYAEPEIRAHDIALLSAQFGIASEPLILRLGNLDLLDKATLDDLRAQVPSIERMSANLGLSPTDTARAEAASGARTLALAIEACHRGHLHVAVVRDLAARLGIELVEELLGDAGVGVADERQHD